MNNGELNLLAVMIHGLIALTAGLMKELNEKKKTGLKITKLIVNGAISSFVGITVYFLAMSFDSSPYLTAFFTSVSGWMGGSMMDFFSHVLKKVVEKKMDINTNE